MSHLPATDENPSTWLGEVQLAELLGVSKYTPRTWRARGVGPTYVKFGQRVRYRPSAVRAWLDAGGDRAASTGPEEK